MKRVYLDHISASPLDERVLKAMLPYLKVGFGNPSSLYEEGRSAREAVEVARARVASLIGAEPEEIIFTSGGSEANNLAIKGSAFARLSEKGRMITSEIEHVSVLHPARTLEKFGYKVSYVGVDGYGLVDPDDVRRLIDKDVFLISVMHANNEVGTIEPIREIAKIAQEHEIKFHTDAVASAGIVPINVKELGVDMLSFSAQQVYGPKGVGALYVKKGTRIMPLIEGGVQELGRRAGTENVAAIVGFGEACRLAQEEMEERRRKLIGLRDELIRRLLSEIDHTRLNGHPTLRLPGNVNVSVEFVEGESVLLFLDMEGISASTGSACTSRALKASHVLLAMGIPHEVAQGSLEFTFGIQNDISDIDRLMEVLPPIVKKLREMSPLYQKYKMAGG